MITEAAGGTIFDLDIEEQRAALADACGLRRLRRWSVDGEFYVYEDADGEEVCRVSDWQPDWDIEQGVRCIDALYVIGELRIMPDIELKKTVYQFCGVCRTPAGECAVHLSGRTCDNASEAMFDAGLQALERRRAWANATA